MVDDNPGQTLPRLPFHYAWLIVAVGCLTIFSCLGLARFAFGVMLPGMREALGLAYDQMGFLSTGNFTGYLVSVIITPVVLKKLGPRLTIMAGLSLIAITLTGLGLARSYNQLLVCYALTGVGSGLANIAIMVLVAHWFQRDQRGKAAGLIVLGNGLGMMFSGFLIPAIRVAWGSEGWRVSWLLLAALVAVTALLAVLVVRNDPAALGLTPFGQGGKSAEAAGGGRRTTTGAGRAVLILGILYFVFGATYMIYGTFIVSSMIGEYGFSEIQAGRYWSWVGFFTMFSGILFGTLSDRIGRKGGLAVVFVIQTCAYLFCASGWGKAALLLSVVCYGITASAIPAIMAAAVGDYLGTARAAAGFSFITLFFAAGQTLGPAVAGIMAEDLGSFAPAFMLSAGLTGAAVVICFGLARPVQDH